MLKLHCQFCGTYCGQRPDEIIFRLARGACVEIVATCADCTPVEDKTQPESTGDIGLDFLLKQF